MKIVVLAGGLSPERDVSFSSGTMAANALLSLGHQSILVDLFFGLPEWDGKTDLFADAAPLPPFRVSESEPDLDALRRSRKAGYNDYIGLNVPELCDQADIVYMALHGDCGENGELQAFFDARGIRYTGSGAKGCRNAMDKWISKQMFEAAGILTPRGRLLQAGDPFDPDSLPVPCVVKPCNGGSSIGVSIVHDRSELYDALKLAFSMENTILVEEYIKGRELSCGVLGETALPPIEIIPLHGFYDYKNKYQAGAAREVTPAEIDPEATERIQKTALDVFRLLGLSVYGRIDFLLTAQGEAYCLEANTLPGMTPTSLLPQEAAVVGYSYERLCDTIIALSLDK
ncbi:MAG: D-alanine--D-alanine ligase [Clostridia bacterium]|nr:D-alanine--D-alanine ligase [Clostridia bacterium]